MESLSKRDALAKLVQPGRSKTVKNAEMVDIAVTYFGYITAVQHQPPSIKDRTLYIIGCISAVCMSLITL